MYKQGVDETGPSGSRPVVALTAKNALWGRGEISVTILYCTYARMSLDLMAINSYTSCSQNQHHTSKYTKWKKKKFWRSWQSRPVVVDGLNISFFLIGQSLAGPIALDSQTNGSLWVAEDVVVVVVAIWNIVPKVYMYCSPVEKYH